MMIHRWFSRNKSNSRRLGATDNRSTTWRLPKARTYLPMGVEQLEQRTCMANDLEIAFPTSLPVTLPAPTNQAAITSHIQQSQSIYDIDCILANMVESPTAAFSVVAEDCMDPAVGPRAEPVLFAQALVLSVAAPEAHVVNARFSLDGHGDTLVHHRADQAIWEVQSVSGPHRPQLVPPVQMMVSEEPTPATSTPAAQPATVAANTQAQRVDPTEASSSAPMAGYVAAIDWAVQVLSKSGDQSRELSENEESVLAAQGADRPSLPAWSGLVAYHANAVERDASAPSASMLRPQLARVPLVNGRGTSERRHSNESEPLTQLRVDVDGLLVAETKVAARSTGTHKPAAILADEVLPIAMDEGLEVSEANTAAVTLAQLLKTELAPESTRHSRWWYLATVPAFFVFMQRRGKRTDLSRKLWSYLT